MNETIVLTREICQLKYSQEKRQMTEGYQA